MNIFNIAYIGCGAVVEKSHLPAVGTIKQLQPTVLIDTNLEQRQKLAKEYGVTKQTSNIDEVINDFDVAVIATPSASHYLIAKKMLDAGKHVLVEKPLSLQLSESLELIELSKLNNLILDVGLVRRYVPAYRMLKSMIESNIVGEIIDFKIEEGSVFNWPVQSEKFYDNNISGGGVLVDTGSHLLDACLWWLGDYDTVDYYDDNQGGVEAECSLDIKLKMGARGSVLMSRIRNLSNQVIINGANGRITLSLLTGEIELQFKNSSSILKGLAQDIEVDLKRATQTVFEHQYQNLYKSITSLNNEGSKYKSLAEGCLPSIRLMEECYKNRKPMPSSFVNYV